MDMYSSSSTPKKRSIFRNPKLIIPVALIIIGGIVALCLALRKKNVLPPLTPVMVETVETNDINIYGEYVGRIRARQFVEVHAHVEGFLEKMFFDEGTFVRKGQLLFSIDPGMYKANADKAKAKLVKAIAVEKKAERDLERIRPLYEQNAASRLDLDNAEAAYESAKADVQVCRAELAAAELELSGTRVEAPISGYVSERKADVGTFVGSSGKTLLATIVNSDTVQIEFSMTSLDYLNSKARNVNLGQRDESRNWDPSVTVTLADGSIYPLRGLVDFADPRVDPKTGTFSVRAEMANPDHTLLPGEFTKVKLLMDVREQAIAIPSKALEIEKGGAYVYVVKPDSIVERRYVETGPEVANSTIIERGLARGENIIIEGYQKVKHGQKVDPVEESDDFDDYTD